MISPFADAVVISGPFGFKRGACYGDCDVEFLQAAALDDIPEHGGAIVRCAQQASAGTIEFKRRDVSTCRTSVRRFLPVSMSHTTTVPSFDATASNFPSGPSAAALPVASTRQISGRYWPPKQLPSGRIRSLRGICRRG